MLKLGDLPLSLLIKRHKLFYFYSNPFLPLWSWINVLKYLFLPAKSILHILGIRQTAILVQSFKFGTMRIFWYYAPNLALCATFDAMCIFWHYAPNLTLCAKFDAMCIFWHYVPNLALCAKTHADTNSPCFLFNRFIYLDHKQHIKIRSLKVKTKCYQEI